MSANDFTLARSLASLCHECAERPHNPGFLLCSNCYHYARNRCCLCRTPIPTNLRYCSTCTETWTFESDDESDHEDVPSETASYEEILAWEKRRMNQESNAMIASLIDIFPCTSPTQHELVQGTKCAICLEAYTADDKIITISCLHRFHQRCMLSWFEQNKPTCPVCMCDVRESLS